MISLNFQHVDGCEILHNLVTIRKVTIPNTGKIHGLILGCLPSAIWGSKSAEFWLGMFSLTILTTLWSLNIWEIAHLCPFYRLLMMIYLLKMVIVHTYGTNHQMVIHQISQSNPMKSPLKAHEKSPSFQPAIPACLIGVRL